MKRIISLIIVVGLGYLAYQWFFEGGANPQKLQISGEVNGSVMILGKSFYEVIEEETQDKVYIYSDDCCPEKGISYVFFVKSSELARLKDKSVNLYTEVRRVEKNY